MWSTRRTNWIMYLLSLIIIYFWLILGSSCADLKKVNASQFNIITTAQRDNGRAWKLPAKKSCGGMPNIPDGRRINWQKTQGTWYVYMQQHPPAFVNGVMHHENLGLTTLPGTTKLAIAQTIRWLHNPCTSSTVCLGRYLYGHLTKYGQFIVSMYPPNEQIPVQFPLTILYTNYNQLQILFSCLEFNLQTGICDDQNIIVQTRRRPDEMSDQLKGQIDKIVERVLRPYCLDMGDFMETPWLSERALCRDKIDVTEPTCYTNAVDGLRQTTHAD